MQIHAFDKDGNNIDHKWTNLKDFTVKDLDRHVAVQPQDQPSLGKLGVVTESVEESKSQLSGQKSYSKEDEREQSLLEDLCFGGASGKSQFDSNTPTKIAQAQPKDPVKHMSSASGSVVGKPSSAIFRK